jgi:hypothetical protein
MKLKMNYFSFCIVCLVLFNYLLAMNTPKAKDCSHKVSSCPKKEHKRFPLGLYVADGQLMRQGKPYVGIGINYFSAFTRNLKNPGDKSYIDGLTVLKEKYNIPFIRFMASGYWPVDWKLYLENRQRYFELMDAFVAEAEKQEIGLIPTFFWYIACVPDIMGEPMDQLGNPESKTIKFIRTYTHDVVSRYVNSPAIWAWEFGNEHILYVDHPRNEADLSFGRAKTAPEFGTPSSRTERDRFTRKATRTTYRIFADEIRKIDHHRLISTGDAMPPENSYHRTHESKWTIDTRQQWKQTLIGDNPGKINSISVHLYPDHEKLYFADKISIKELIAMCNEIAISQKKPLFVGEFGAPRTIENPKGFFYKSLDAIEQAGVPLAALWVFDFPGQNDTWNITVDSDREYMLRAVKEANARITCKQKLNRRHTYEEL